MSDYRRILVVTPTLGESVFLDRTMDSVAMQPLDIIHVISAPAKKQRALQVRFPHARVVIDNGKEGGIYGAINAALTQTTGEWDWFTYINDDDLLLPGFSEVFYRHLRSAASEPVIYGDVALIDERDRKISLVTTERNPVWIPALLQQGISPLMQQGMLFRRETVRRLQEFDTRYRLCADLDFWLRAYAAGEEFRYYPTCVAQFRVRGGQLSGNTALTMREQEEIISRHLPVPVSRLKRQVARWRYRTCNLPRYMARVRSRGFRTSYQLLQEGASRP
ncbi:MAG TPA: glycosyltransferase [Opitutaceae bacterium]|jgi:GT2 family glycosyltransferase|nr:glycosyltransferase [Opitutaceae bacterium]